jgi:transposase
LRAPEVQPNPENATPEELRVAMEAAPNKRSYLRRNAIRSLLLGIARSTLCQQFCRTDRMLRRWIELFDRGGLDALITKPPPGRRRKVKLERGRDLLLPVLENPATVGQGHWTAVKLHGYLKEQRRVFCEERHAWGADPKVELWFGAESGLEGDPRPRRRWGQPGQPRPVP